MLLNIVLVWKSLLVISKFNIFNMFFCNIPLILLFIKQFVFNLKFYFV